MRRAIAIILAAMIILPMQVRAAEIPQEIKEAAEGIGEAYCVSPDLILAICYEESRFTPEIINRSGKNYGLMQVNPVYNVDRMRRLGVTREELLTVKGNIMVGTDLLAELFEDYEDVVDVLLVYGGYSKAKIARYHKDGTIPARITRLLERAKNYEERREGANDVIREGKADADGAAAAGIDG